MIRRLPALVPLLAAALASLLTLPGCSDSSSSSSEGASRTETSTYAGPAMPSEAQGETGEAADAYVRHWVDTLNYATESGDTEGLKSLATESCSNCAAFAQTLDELRGKGGHVETDGWTLESVAPEGDRPEGQPAFQLRLEVPPQKVYPTSDSKPTSYPGGDQSARIVLVSADDHWLVESLDM